MTLRRRLRISGRRHRPRRPEFHEVRKCWCSKCPPHPSYDTDCHAPILRREGRPDVVAADLHIVKVGLEKLPVVRTNADKIKRDPATNLRGRQAHIGDVEDVLAVSGGDVKAAIGQRPKQLRYVAAGCRHAEAGGAVRAYCT